jgi:phospholipid-binding lipoprotein MlaA
MLGSKNKWNFLKLLLVVLIFSTVGCATNTAPSSPQDPYEHFNRKVFDFNQAVDHAFIRPVAKVYDKVLPWQLKTGIRHVFNNMGDVTSAANEILQLNFPQAIADLTRVVINTIFGIGGLFDVATALGIERDIEDFGLTLAHWGSRSSPYLVLPFIGASTVRDAVGLAINYTLLSPWDYIPNQTVKNITAGTYVVQRRAMLLIGDDVVNQAFDPYVFIRDAYLQRREFLVKEGELRQVEKFVDGNGISHRKTRKLQSSNIVD